MRLAIRLQENELRQRSAHLEAELLVDLEGLLEHLVADRDLAHRRPVEVVQPVDVVLHPRLVGLDRRDDQQVLRSVRDQHQHEFTPL